MHRARERQGTPRMRACACRRYESRADISERVKRAKQWTMKIRRITPLLASSLSRQPRLPLLLACLLRHLLPLSPPLAVFPPPSFFVASTLTRNIRVKLWCALPLSADQLDHWSIDRSIGRRIIEIEPPSRDENNFLISYRPSFPSGLLELLAASAD